MKNKNIKNYTRNILMLLFLISFLFPLKSRATALDLPKDSEGWTIFTPSDDSRIMYVSNEGNDSTGQIYDDSDAVLGGNPFNPTGPINTYATYAAAYANARSGYADWILFKRGETFYQTVGSMWNNGRSASEPFLIGSYGDDGLSPVLKVGASSGLVFSTASPSTPRTIKYVAIQGMHFYAHTRNPSDLEYSDSAGSNGLNILAYNSGNVVKNILFEGCAFLYFSNNSIQSGAGAEHVADIDLRRNIFAYNYSVSTAHSQGLYSYLTDRLLLEENIFNHNGWLVQAGSGGNGQATIFNHNTYFASVSDAVFSKNIFIRPSSMQNKFTGEYYSNNIILDNNLYIDGEIGIGMGTNYLNNEWRFVNPTITNNIFASIGVSRPTNRDLAWSLQIAGWDGGTIANNLELNSSASLAGAFALSIEDQSRNVDIYDNIILGHQSASRLIYLNYAGNSSNVHIFNNYFETPGENDSLVYSNETPGEVSFSGNQYYGPASSNFYINPDTFTFSQWQASTEPTSTFLQKSFPDRTRSIETYQASLSEIASIDAFAEKVTAQDRYSWDSRFTAPVVGAWIKTGFFAELYRGDVDNSSTTNTTDALLTLRNSLGLSMTGTAWQASATTGDVDCNGTSNSTDALLILRYSLGLNMTSTAWCE